MRSRRNKVIIDIILTTLIDNMTKPTFDDGLKKQRLQRDTENEKVGLQLCVFATLCECVKTSVSLYQCSTGNSKHLRDKNQTGGGSRLLTMPQLMIS